MPMDDADDARVARCLNGDVGGFEEIVEAYQTPLFNVALRMLRNREEARDATQCAFVSAWGHLSGYEPRQRLASWLYRILRNEVLGRIRRRKAMTELNEALADPGPGAESRAEAGETAVLLERALQVLTPELREVLVLKYWLDLSYEEMAERVGIPPKTVKSRLFTARQRLGAWLQRAGAAR